MELSRIQMRNDTVTTTLTPYLVCTPFNLPHMHRHPLGLSILDEHVIDPLRVDSEDFLLLLQRLDTLTFGPEGMPMPRWVFYDCSELPGAIFGFGLPVEKATEHVRQLFQVPVGYRGLLPYSMYIAIPMYRRGSWFGHNLCSIAPSLPDSGLRGLGSITKALGLKVFGVGECFGATQWDSKALFIHSKFGPLSLHTAYTPAHSEAETLTYSFSVTDEGIRSALGDPTVSLVRPDADEYVTFRDVTRMIELQDAIESGHRFLVPSVPLVDSDGTLRVPVTHLDRS